MNSDSTTRIERPEPPKTDRSVGGKSTDSAGDYLAVTAARFSAVARRDFLRSALRR
jgi:hypothetical protein